MSFAGLVCTHTGWQPQSLRFKTSVLTDSGSELTPKLTGSFESSSLVTVVQIFNPFCQRMVRFARVCGMDWSEIVTWTNLGKLAINDVLADRGLLCVYERDCVASCCLSCSWLAS